MDILVVIFILLLISFVVIVLIIILDKDRDKEVATPVPVITPTPVITPPPVALAKATVTPPVITPIPVTSAPLDIKPLEPACICGYKFNNFEGKFPTTDLETCRSIAGAGAECEGEPSSSVSTATSPLPAVINPAPLDIKPLEPKCICGYKFNNFEGKFPTTDLAACRKIAGAGAECEGEPSSSVSTTTTNAQIIQNTVPKSSSNKCADIPPAWATDKDCQTMAKFGGCNESWMNGFCLNSCGKCDNTTSLQINVKKTRAHEVNEKLSPGINFGAALESCVDGMWGMYISEQDVINVHKRGFKSVRLPVRWQFQLENDNKTIKPAYMKRVEQIIDWCLSRNLYVMLNIHHYDSYIENPHGLFEQFKSFWTQISEHFKNKSDYLLFEILNEPRSVSNDNNGCHFMGPPKKTFTSIAKNDILHIHFPVILNIIRKTNPNRIVIIGGDNYNGLHGLAGFDPKLNDENLILTFHYYEPFEFTHYRHPYAFNQKDWKPDDFVTYTDVTTGTQRTTTKLQKIQRDFKYGKFHADRLGMPLLLGEFGTSPGKKDDPVDHQSRIDWLKAMVDTCKTNDISYFYFDLRSVIGAGPQNTDGTLNGMKPEQMHFGIFDTMPTGLAEDGHFIEDLTNILVPNNPIL